VAIVPARFLRGPLAHDLVLSDADVMVLATTAWTCLHPAGTWRCWTSAAAALATRILRRWSCWAATTVVTYPALLCPPVAIAVAVLRYRLWELDWLISRTVTYALVTALLVVPYLLILPAATRLTQGAGSLAVAAATLAAAAAFQPVRRRVQDRVDRRFNRRRFDAVRTVETFAGRLREQVETMLAR
jgi:hypothetical protein